MFCYCRPLPPLRAGTILRNKESTQALEGASWLVAFLQSIRGLLLRLSGHRGREVEIVKTCDRGPAKTEWTSSHGQETPGFRAAPLVSSHGNRTPACNACRLSFSGPAL